MSATCSKRVVCRELLSHVTQPRPSNINLIQVVVKLADDEDDEIVACFSALLFSASVLLCNNLKKRRHSVLVKRTFTRHSEVWCVEHTTACVSHE